MNSLYRSSQVHDQGGGISDAEQTPTGSSYSSSHPQNDQFFSTVNFTSDFAASWYQPYTEPGSTPRNPTTYHDHEPQQTKVHGSIYQHQSAPSPGPREKTKFSVANLTASSIYADADRYRAHPLPSFQDSTNEPILQSVPIPLDITTDAHAWQYRDPFWAMLYILATIVFLLVGLVNVFASTVSWHSAHY